MNLSFNYLFLNNNQLKNLNNYTLKQYLKILLLIIAMAIGVFSLWYSNNLVKKLSDEEKKNIQQWAEAQEMIAKAEPDQDISYYAKIIESNTTIPVILADNQSILSYRNLDSNLIKNTKKLQLYYEDLKSKNAPIPIEITDNYSQYLYYDDSSILKQLKVYPFYQLGIVGLFVVVSYFAFSYSRRSEQNKVWVGLAKETAHQLGTPMSSLMAWVDLMEMDNSSANPETYMEMRKDLDRLKVITERFSKIGSAPVLHEVNIVEIIEKSLNYMKTRSAENVHFEFYHKEDNYSCMINVYLFEWVIENLCKNSIDAMEGKGNISVNCFSKNKMIYIDFTDTGKGIPSSLQKRVFKPGFTTKKRGWGLGLSLVKRIIENYHKGHIFVKESVPNKKTTFRITIKQK